jgi:hypothetical protein
MPAEIRPVGYFNATVRDRPGEAYRLLSRLAEEDVSLLAFNAVPQGPSHTQLVIFPQEESALARVSESMGLVLTGPQYAFLIQGDDRLGALVEVHEKLNAANINVFASNGVTDGRGAFGYVIYLRPQDFDEAVRVLGL